MSKQRTSAIKEVETAKSELHNLQAASPPEPDKITLQQKKLDVAQKNLEATKQRLDALTKARAALRDQSAIRTLIGELKIRLDELPTEGSPAQKEERAAIKVQISELEKADRALKAPGGWGESSTWLFVVIVLILLGVSVYLYASKSGKNQTDDDAVARVRLSR